MPSLKQKNVANLNMRNDSLEKRISDLLFSDGQKKKVVHHLIFIFLSAG